QPIKWLFNKSFSLFSIHYFWLFAFCKISIASLSPAPLGAFSYNIIQRFSAIRRQGFSPLNYLRRTEL
ncbi:MAG: hypothetical protein ACXIU2_20940, partial [Cyclobacteriaceae bacterium]